MNISKNFSLKPFNTMGIGAIAKYFATFESGEELREILNFSDDQNKLLILGGGSNILLTKDFDGLVLQNRIPGIDIIEENVHHVYVRAGAGVNWQTFVEYCIGRGFAGVENLSLIPGSVGASPMQNIGAYGVELKDVFHELEAYHIRDKKTLTFSVNDCHFGYRDSIFKKELKDQFVILNVIFRLDKTPHFNTGYGAIKEELERMNEPESIKSIATAVSNIRRSKLPDPKVIGNAGSFFKNPLVSKEKFEKMKADHPNVPGYPQEGNEIKLAAGWLVEQCGWKGYRKGDAGVHEKQALVLVNYGNAHGTDLMELGEEIRHSVWKNFEVDLEREVNVI